MIDDRVGPFGGGQAGYADRTELELADLAVQRLVRHRISDVLEFVAQGADPQVRIVDQAGSDVGQEDLERVRCAAFAHSGGGGAVEITEDRVAIAAGVSGDRRDRPASLS